jgi:hypothetical protein
MTVMLSQSVLSTITYTPPVSSTAAPPDPERAATHSSLALSTLRTLSHLSFVITKFGGVTSTSGVGFAELKRVFYSALDVLSADVEASETFVKSLDTPGLSITGCLLSQLFRSSPCSKFRKVQAQGAGQRIPSYVPGKHSTLRASNSSSLYFPSKRSKTLSFLCAFRMLASCHSVHNGPLLFISVTWMTHHIARRMSLRTRSFWPYLLRMRARNRIRLRCLGPRVKARCEQPS